METGSGHSTWYLVYCIADEQGGISRHINSAGALSKPPSPPPTRHLASNLEMQKLLCARNLETLALPTCHCAMLPCSPCSRARLVVVQRGAPSPSRDRLSNTATPGSKTSIPSRSSCSRRRRRRNPIHCRVPLEIQSVGGRHPTVYAGNKK